jgi:hypothetical protein
MMAVNRRIWGLALRFPRHPPLPRRETRLIHWRCGHRLRFHIRAIIVG